MAEMYRNSITESEINSLEKSLKQFDMPCLLEELDMSLELVRRNKETKEKHLELLKSVDKNLLKLSRSYHPDKAIREKKSDHELTNAQNLQIALNATRTVLKTLTEEFLNDIDVHYKYEFFAKLDTKTLINEKQIDTEINNVLCKISRLSEVKRVNIIGEIRKFLQKSQTCLKNFLRGSKHDFVRYRDHALRHLHNCIEGYKIFATECKLIDDECTADNDENTKTAIRKIAEESLTESEVLQNLEAVAKRSLIGTFEIFPTYRDHYFIKPEEYQSVVPKEYEYFVLPFILYVDVLLMCSAMIDKKSRWIKLIMKIEEYCFGDDSQRSIGPFKEQALLKAYYLVSNFINRNHYRKQVQSILKHKLHSENNIREAFRETVREIEQLLDEQFNVNSYKEGKSNREQFNEKLFELNDSMTNFKEVENDLLEKFKLYEQQTNEIRKEYFELFEKNELSNDAVEPSIPQQNTHENNISTECDSGHIAANQTASCVQSHNFSNANESNVIKSLDYQLSKDVSKNPEDIDKVLPNIKANNTFPECSSCNKTAQITNILSHDFSKENDESSKQYAKEIPGVSRDQLMKDSLSCQQSKRASEKKANVDIVPLQIKTNNTSTEYSSGIETTNQTVQMAYNQSNDSSEKHDKSLKVLSEEILDASRDQLIKLPLNVEISKRMSNKSAKTDIALLNKKENNTFPERSFVNKTTNQNAQVAKNQSQNSFEEHDKCSKAHAEEIHDVSRYQLIKEPISNLLAECISNKPAETEILQLKIKENHTTPYHSFVNKTKNQSVQMANNQGHNSSEEHDKYVKAHAEEIPNASREQLIKKLLSGQLLSESMSNKPEETDIALLNIKENDTSPEHSSGNKTTKQNVSMANNQSPDSSEKHKCSKTHTEEIHDASRDELIKEPLSSQLSEHISNEPTETGIALMNIKANDAFPERNSNSKTTSQNVQTANNHSHDSSKEHDKYSKHAKKNNDARRDQLIKEPLSGQLSGHTFNEPAETAISALNIKANNTSPKPSSENKTENQTVQMAINQSQDSSNEHDEYSKKHAEEINDARRDQLIKKPLSGQLSKHTFNEPAETAETTLDIKANNTSPEPSSKNKNENQTVQMAINQSTNSSDENDKCSKTHAEEIHDSRRDQLIKEPLSCQLSERTSNEPAETSIALMGIKVINTSPERSYCNKTENQTVQWSVQSPDFSEEPDKCSKTHIEEIHDDHVDQLIKEPLSGQLFEHTPNEPAEAGIVRLNIKANNTSPERSSDNKPANESAQISYNRDSSKERDNCSKLHFSETPGKNQQNNESLKCQFSENISNEPAETDM